MNPKTIAIALAACSVMLAIDASAGHHYSHHTRSRWVTQEFERENPCPSTGKTYGSCPGWIKDHVVPLCKDGADAVWNMQWQTKSDAAAKDKWECR
jgi:hypothetical protein